ncbi:MAG TPA: NAD(P)/FAD-dependent oxidoreductase [Dehalococcoidia bacterium]|jgi:NAD(P)H-nitrite reductase large subunit|nr:NAD(P)/FAD-dependent oxidoreductase [Dehalococcoidia bacterium]
MAKNIAKAKYLIIGNCAGGIGAAEAIREVDAQGTLVIISDEPYPAYSRPLISEHLAEGCPLERMLLRPADFYERNHIQTFLGKKAERIDLDEHIVKLDSGESIAWQKLLLATGGLPIVPPMEGASNRGVFTFTTLDDAKAIDRYLSRGARAVVIGGGLIGVSVAEALVKRDAKVTIVEMKERILNVMLDEEASALEEERLRQAGIDIITGHTVAKISASDGAVSGVTLDDRQQVPCDLVVIAIGVRPRTELAADSGIKINRGILVDQYMATSHPDVYACGDVAEAYDVAYGERRLTPIWPNAYLGGRVAGFNMAGKETEYPGGTAMNSLKYFGMDIVSAGIVNPPDDSYEVLSQRHDSTYRKIILKDGRVVGLVFVGNIEKSGIVLNLIRNQVRADGFKQALVAEDFGLSILPRELWQPHLRMPASAQISQVVTEHPEEEVAGE